MHHVRAPGCAPALRRSVRTSPGTRPQAERTEETLALLVVLLQLCVVLQLLLGCCPAGASGFSCSVGSVMLLLSIIGYALMLAETLALLYALRSAFLANKLYVMDLSIAAAALLVSTGTASVLPALRARSCSRCEGGRHVGRCLGGARGAGWMTADGACTQLGLLGSTLALSPLFITRFWRIANAVATKLVRLPFFYLFSRPAPRPTLRCSTRPSCDGQHRLCQPGLTLPGNPLSNWRPVARRVVALAGRHAGPPRRPHGAGGAVDARARGGEHPAAAGGRRTAGRHAYTTDQHQKPKR